MFFFLYFSFPLSVSFHHCSILIHSSTTHAVKCFSSCTSVSPVSINPPLLHTHSFIYYGQDISSAINSSIKQYSKRRSNICPMSKSFMGNTPYSDYPSNLRLRSSLVECYTAQIGNLLQTFRADYRCHLQGLFLFWWNAFGLSSYWGTLWQRARFTRNALPWKPGTIFSPPHTHTHTHTHTHKHTHARARARARAILSLS